MRRRLITWILWPLIAMVVRWIRCHERSILATGRPLRPSEQGLARRAGVREVDRIRVLAVATIPMPGPTWLHRLARRWGFPAGAAAGMSLRYGIYLCHKFEDCQDILVHECVHTAQYETLGFREFLQEYLYQCVTDGYHQAPLELEAVQVSSQVRGH